MQRYKGTVQNASTMMLTNTTKGLHNDGTKKYTKVPQWWYQTLNKGSTIIVLTVQKKF